MGSSTTIQPGSQDADRRDAAKSSVVAIDIGGTIEDTWSAKQSWFAARGFDIGLTPVGRREIVERVGDDEALYEAMVRDIYSDTAIASHDLTDGCATALEVLATRFRIVILSSRPAYQYAITHEWLVSHGLHRLIDNLICIGSSSSKAAWCRAVNARFIVDDDLRHLETIELDEGLCPIHYSVASDRTTRADSGVLAAFSWPDVVSIIWRLDRTATTAAIGGTP
jgi:hypothetical protein